MRPLGGNSYTKKMLTEVCQQWEGRAQQWTERQKQMEEKLEQ